MNAITRRPALPAAKVGAANSRRSLGDIVAMARDLNFALSDLLAEQQPADCVGNTDATAAAQALERLETSSADLYLDLEGVLFRRPPATATDALAIMEAAALDLEESELEPAEREVRIAAMTRAAAVIAADPPTPTSTLGNMLRALVEVLEEADDVLNAAQAAEDAAGASAAWQRHSRLLDELRALENATLAHRPSNPGELHLLVACAAQRLLQVRDADEHLPPASIDDLDRIARAMTLAAEAVEDQFGIDREQSAARWMLPPRE